MEPRLTVQSKKNLYCKTPGHVEIKCKVGHNKAVDFNTDPYGLVALFLPVQVKWLEGRV